MKQNVTGVLVFVLFIGFCYLVATWLVSGFDNQDMNRRFEGACAVKGGVVHADLCVKDGRVVLTKDALKKILQGS